jgi:type IV pilus assembly protein PilW
MLNKQRGFSLIEIFIALAVGVGLFAGVMSVFVGMKTTSTETSTYGELQENGRFALSLLSDDLLRQDFWGDYTGSFDFASLSAVPSAPSSDCTGDGINNATFPLVNGHFRTIWGETVTNASILGCITDAKLGSDVLQVKRVISNPVTVTTSNNYYLVTNLSGGELFTGTAIPVIDNSQVWEYQHHVYYVREESQGSNTVPVLMQGRLTSKMTFDPIIDGIEMIRFMYGVDTTGDNIVNAFISGDNMTDQQWDNGSTNQILAVKVYVLARSVLPDFKYTNSNTYQMGDLAVTVDDNYRRLLFSATVTLYNAGIDSW